MIERGSDEMNKKQIEQLFTEKVIKISLLEKGITNDNYYVETEKESFIVRIPPKENQAIFNRHHEKKAMDLVQSLKINIQPIYFDIKTGIKITPYLPNLLDFEEYKGIDKIEKTANLMKKLHQAKLQSGFPFDPVKRFYTYYNRIKQPLYQYEDYLSIIQSIKSTSTELILCHNDWVSGNVCFTETDTYLIDYEYAGDNDPLFDVMSFITENQLTLQQREQFLDNYFDGTISESTQEQLNLWESFHNLLWTAWANMMYDQSQKEIFKKISKEKYNALLNSYPKR